jgi:hypothetical protein
MKDNSSKETLLFIAMLFAFVLLCFGVQKCTAQSVYNKSHTESGFELIDHIIFPNGGYKTPWGDTIQNCSYELALILEEYRKAAKKPERHTKLMVYEVFQDKTIKTLICIGDSFKKDKSSIYLFVDTANVNFIRAPSKEGFIEFIKGKLNSGPNNLKK